MQSLSSLLALSLALLAASPFSASAQSAWIQGFGQFGTGTFSSGAAISDNGSVVAGTAGIDAGGAFRPVLWTGNSAALVPGLSGNGGFNDLNGDGTVGTGAGAIGSSGSQTFLWTSLGGFQPTPLANALGISSDGTTIVGEAFASGPGLGGRAASWSVAGGINIFGPGNSFAYDANSNGTIAVGVSGEIASLWDLSGPPSQTLLGTLTGDNTSQAESVSADGTVVVGFSRDGATSSARAFRWTLETGMTDLGRLNEDATSTFANFVSSNGQYILGGSIGGDGLTGLIWTELAGPTSLESYLLAGGVNLTDWSGILASGITDDGRYLTGRGTYQGLQQGFVAEVVPEPSTYVLLALAAAGLGAHVLRQRQK